MLSFMAISAPVAVKAKNLFEKAKIQYGQILNAPSDAVDYVSSLWTSNHAPMLTTTPAPKAPFYAPLFDPKNSANVTIVSAPVFTGFYGYYKAKKWYHTPSETTCLNSVCSTISHPMKSMKRAIVPVVGTTLIAPTLTGFAHHIWCSKD